MARNNPRSHHIPRYLAWLEGPKFVTGRGVESWDQGHKLGMYGVYLYGYRNWRHPARGARIENALAPVGQKGLAFAL